MKECKFEAWGDKGKLMAFLFVLSLVWKCEGTASELNCPILKKANNHQLLLKHLILIKSSLTLN